MPTRWLRSDSRKQMLRRRSAFRQLVGLLKAGHLWAREGGSADLREKLGYAAVTAKASAHPMDQGARIAFKSCPSSRQPEQAFVPSHRPASHGVAAPRKGKTLSKPAVFSRESLPEFPLTAAASNTPSSWENEDLSPEGRHGGHTSVSTRWAKIWRKNIPDRGHKCKLPEAEASLA